MFLRSHPKTASCLLGLTGVLGILVNLFILHRVIYGKLFGKSFGRIWISRGIAYVAISALFAFYVPIVAFIDINLIYNIGWMRAIPHLMMFFGMTILYSNFLIAINRCIIISQPLQYKYLFCDLKTIIMIVCTWLIPFVSVLPNLVDPCHQTPLDSDYSFFALPPECHTLVNVLDLVVPSAAIIATIGVDLLAICRLRKFAQVRKKLTTSKAVKQNRNRELRLCCMILVQAVVSIYAYISLGFAAFIDNEILQFLASSFTWGLLQTIDGIVVILFNTEMHSSLRRKSTIPPRRTSEQSFYVG
ncbi:hypothetical protein QR680_007157 [Steinernema hermaphroditum]|uniref:G-protein coupled receptors family 1 profile domain-containing protein n=1 Tax=Steinernema hermaphroditum TaxID=289476 RepID=A0AA39LYN2_9BILA|nr:hypothetical protein QR680_007157 [Steinernema hermaphroditum]